MQPIEQHHYYACSWIVNHHGINQFEELAAIADELGIELRVRQMFTDNNHGYVMYPFTVTTPDEQTLRTFLDRVALGMGMEDWYIVNEGYFAKGLPFGPNLYAAQSRMPEWEASMRKFADHNAAIHEAQQNE